MFDEVEDQPKKTKKESSRRFLKSSVANDLSLEYEGVLTSSGTEDLSSLRQSMLKDFFQTHCTFLTKYIVISCIDVDLIWRSDQVSFVYYTILRKGLYHPSAGQHFKPKHLKTKGTSCTLLKTCVHPLLNRCPMHLMHETLYIWRMVQHARSPALKHSSSLSALAFSL
ncbi:hypothetical protein L6452_03214 [Arctium lappa]|uniref:Uncharacterized protein n=1 Tax=Arctium lappa TaxID=4217 RepID=A0ACB9FMH3_ARCLA|nr:hypothetical protein L6452_03214 [Arctium lappa]